MQSSSSVLGEKGDNEEDEVLLKIVGSGALNSVGSQVAESDSHLVGRAKAAVGSQPSCRYKVLPIRNNNTTAVSGIRQEDNGV